MLVCCSCFGLGWFWVVGGLVLGWFWVWALRCVLVVGFD